MRIILFRFCVNVNIVAHGHPSSPFEFGLFKTTKMIIKTNVVIMARVPIMIINFFRFFFLKFSEFNISKITLIIYPNYTLEKKNLKKCGMSLMKLSV